MSYTDSWQPEIRFNEMPGRQADHSCSRLSNNSGYERWGSVPNRMGQGLGNLDSGSGMIESRRQSRGTIGRSGKRVERIWIAEKRLKRIQRRTSNRSPVRNPGNRHRSPFCPSPLVGNAAKDFRSRIRHNLVSNRLLVGTPASSATLQHAVSHA